MSTRNEQLKERMLSSNLVYNNIDVREFLNSLGIEYVDHGEYLRMRCLFPDHTDRKPSFSINTHNYGFNCWGCNRTGTFSELAEELGWQVQKIGTVLTGLVQQYEWSDFKRNLSTLYSVVDEKVYPIPDGYACVREGDKRCDAHLKYAEKRGMLELLDEFKMGYTIIRDGHADAGGKALYGRHYIGRLLIPIHNIDGKYIWTEGRAIHANAVAKYWRPYGVQRNRYLFNIHRVIRKRFRWVVVTEGVLTAAMLWHWGFPAVAVYGSAISDQQIEQLMYFDTVYMNLDNDNAGRQGYMKFKQSAEFSGISLYHIVMPPGKDALDTGRELFEKKFLNARKIR
jgi:hypothetical protein